MLFNEFDIVYVKKNVIKAEVFVDHLAENPFYEEYESLKTNFSDEKVSLVGENISEAYLGLRLLFDGVTNHQGKGIEVILLSESIQHYSMAGIH